MLLGAILLCFNPASQVLTNGEEISGREVVPYLTSRKSKKSFKSF
jgi:hypothetical protein